MPELVSYCTMVMGNIWSAEKLLGIPFEIAGKATKDDENIFVQKARISSTNIFNHFPVCKHVGYTFRFDEADGVSYSGVLATKDEQWVSHTYSTHKVIGRVGSGDCFMAGLIYGILKGHSEKQVIDFSSAAAYLKLQQAGDCTVSTTDDINNLIQTYE